MAFLTVLIFLTGIQAEGAVRIKDITTIHNEDEIDLIGYGLIIGLDGTGDGKGALFTIQSLSNMMERITYATECIVASRPEVRHLPPQDGHHHHNQSQILVTLAGLPQLNGVVFYIYATLHMNRWDKLSHASY